MNSQHEHHHPKQHQNEKLLELSTPQAHHHQQSTAPPNLQHHVATTAIHSFSIASTSHIPGYYAKVRNFNVFRTYITTLVMLFYPKRVRNLKYLTHSSQEIADEFQTIT